MGCCAEYAATSALKYEAVDIDQIPITTSELDIIESMNGVQIERLAFTLLCLASIGIWFLQETDY